jgi:hypothetical protein
LADLDFERRLERMFGEAPDFSDAGAFAERVERRLNRGWQARRWVIGAAGVAGGVIGVSQLMMSNVFQQLKGAEQSARAVSSGIGQIGHASDWLAALSGGGNVVWIAAGLAVLSMGFVLTRVIEEI